MASHLPPPTTKDTILETGAAVTQDFKPIKNICAHLNAFHIYVSDPKRSVEANHYCTHLNADVSFPSFMFPSYFMIKQSQGEVSGGLMIWIDEAMSDLRLSRKRSAFDRC